MTRFGNNITVYNWIGITDCNVAIAPWRLQLISITSLRKSFMMSVATKSVVATMSKHQQPAVS